MLRREAGRDPSGQLADGVINTVDKDDRFVHVPVNREESAIGLCSGAYMGAMGSACLMGASGFMTVIYAITKINYTYEIPLFLMATLRGAAGDHHKHHVSNGLYLRPVLDAINMPYHDHRQAGGHILDLAVLSSHPHRISRPMVVLAHARPAAREAGHHEIRRLLPRHRAASQRTRSS